MEERINKPRVFLSHSKQNSEFIEKLANDLRNCQIEPWLDTVEIRHGKSWQDSIFEYGLPTCDAIIVYFTELSIQSPVVKKEMDVGLLQNLKDNNVAFLPYVSDSKLREKLRPDIQAIQVPEWNNSNYLSLLPRVVAEIWRSYLERTITFAIKDERLRRTELELELAKRNNQVNSIFSLSENAEFEFITSSFSKMIEVTVIQFISNSENEKENISNSYIMNVNLLSVIATLANLNKKEFTHDGMEWNILNECIELIRTTQGLVFEEASSTRDTYKIDDFPSITEDLRLYALVSNLPYDGRSQYSIGGSPVSYKMVFSEKFFDIDTG